jgi:hypothetical protein
VGRDRVTALRLVIYKAGWTGLGWGRGRNDLFRFVEAEVLCRVLQGMHRGVLQG